ncbi:MAG: YsnF/AvaK domain-containing protein [Pyrinomonadaceae bacterium]
MEKIKADKIIPYSKQDEYDLVNSGQNCLGWTVVDQAGNEIGTVTEMLINTETETVDSIVVNNARRIAASDIALRDKRVVVRGVRAEGQSKTYNETEIPAAMAGASGAKYVAGMTREASDDEIVLPVIEEQFKVGKRTIDRGGARVRTKVEEVPVEEQVTLREEHVNVERRPANRPVENAPAAFKEGTIEVREMAEVPVVGKEARVVEEVVVGKNVTEHQETVRETVKRTNVDVENIDRNADHKH